ncbi:leukotriene A-4 hydrolase-like [Temnothorax longispinosus]|uniref:leukotriene A-4 hydrolase-like n=1 Tax=Temnothorax longispinosus TaxID=300112 RepID=UPI003A9A64EA
MYMPSSSNMLKIGASGISSSPVKRYFIKIEYETSPNSPALYWLTPDQTSDGTHPLLISNSKLTYARAIFPCQDTPSQKSVFHAEISVPMGFNVMMAGHSNIMHYDGDRLIYKFNSNTRIPSYAVFIIIGSLAQVTISMDCGTCTLFAERKYIQQSIMAFDRNIINYVLLIVNNIINKYPLRILNVCVLPPNIPEFDMQCPFVTFMSATLLGGNYSLKNTIVQNIVESWIGGLVTIANFEHLWLIKSFSAFIYRKIINNIVDIEMQELLDVKGINDLINLHGHVALVPDLTDVLPNNIIKYVPYEKGRLLLNYLELFLCGPEAFQTFLLSYLRYCDSTSSYLSIRTADFKEYLYCCFCRNRHRGQVFHSDMDWDEWFYGLGLPPTHLGPVRRIACHLKAEQWITEQRIEEVFSTVSQLSVTNDLNKIEFLAYLHASPMVLSRYKLHILRYAVLHDQHICEIRFLWLRLCIKCKWLEMARPALEFACEYCMPKYACPIFRDLYEWTVTRYLAISWFKGKYLKMVPETIKALESILGVKLDDTN